MTLSAVVTFAGGIGLFLLGMRLMTDGLKVAAGDTLRRILASATRSRLRGLASGVLITTVVQSSSAVIFATVGFVNAGLLTLYQAIGVIYGSNLGTTLTSWIVAVVGFNVDLQALAMPAIGLGMALWVLRSTRPAGALGQALAGFGLFFLGIDVLRDTFAGGGEIGGLDRWADAGIPGLLLFTGAGMLLTVLMQSSSAALAVTLTAAAGGLVPFQAAAAMVIGANVGTTSTAAFAVIGATAPAKRAASAHVLFNVITAVVAFSTLPLLLWLVAELGRLLGVHEQVATSLAIFHTITKLLGIALMWPLTGWLVATLENRFHGREEDLAKPRFLDRNVQVTPALAMDALTLELHRMTATARELAIEAISAEPAESARLTARLDPLTTLNFAMADFTTEIAREAQDPRLTHALPDALQVGQYAVSLGEQALDFARLQGRIEIEDPALAEARNHLHAHAVDLLRRARPDAPGWDPEALLQLQAEFETEYQALKAKLLRAGTLGVLSARRMAVALEQLSCLHRIVDQGSKASRYLQRVIDYRAEPGSDPPTDDSSAPGATPAGAPPRSDEVLPGAERPG